jgi:hypothetical protein
MTEQLRADQQVWKQILFNGLMEELPNAMLAKRFPTFINKSGLPVNLETWQTKCFGMEEMEIRLVLPGKKVVLASSTGEWYLNTYLDYKLAEQWTKAGYRTGDSVGKFRDRPCASGDYSWMDEESFDIIYDAKKRTATFVKL